MAKSMTNILKRPIRNEKAKRKEEAKINRALKKSRTDQGDWVESV